MQEAVAGRAVGAGEDSEAAGATEAGAMGATSEAAMAAALVAEGKVVVV